MSAMIQALLIDLSAIFWWQWHATAGQDRDAAFNRTVDLVSDLSEGFDPVIVCCDTGKSFRYEIDPQYKANRPPRDEAALSQLGRVKRDLTRRGYRLLGTERYEADDVIATLCSQAPQDTHVTIAGSDKDLLQLVGPRVSFMRLRDRKVLDTEGVFAELGVRPDQIRDFLALVGDAADNVRGIRGVGPKKAAALLQQFNTLDEIVRRADEIEQPAIREAIKAHPEALTLSTRLVSLAFDAPGADWGTPANDTTETETETEETPMTTETNTTTNGAAREVPEPRPTPVPPSEPRPVPKPAPAKAGGPRFSVASVTRGPDKKPHRFILTGRSGAGKTYLLSTIPGVFIIPIEEGLKGASPNHSPDYFDAIPRTFDELMSAIDVFAGEVNARVDGKRPYKHLGLDTLTGIESLIHAKVSSVEKVAHMAAKEYNAVWHAAEPLWLALQRKLDAVRDSGVHVWLIAHSDEIVDASSETGEVFRKWDLLLKGPGKAGASMRNMWRAWADHVLFLDWTVQVQAGNKTRRAIGRFDGRVLYARESATHYAKNRANLPAKIPGTWKDLEAALRAGIPASDAKLRGQIEEILTRLDSDARAQIQEDMREARGENMLAAILSRAQGMLAIARDEQPEDDSNNANDASAA